MTNNDLHRKLKTEQYNHSKKPWVNSGAPEGLNKGNIHDWSLKRTLNNKMATNIWHCSTAYTYRPGIYTRIFPRRRLRGGVRPYNWQIMLCSISCFLKTSNSCNLAPNGNLCDPQTPCLNFLVSLKLPI